MPRPHLRLATFASRGLSQQEYEKNWSREDKTAAIVEQVLVTCIMVSVGGGHTKNYASSSGKLVTASSKYHMLRWLRLLTLRTHVKFTLIPPILLRPTTPFMIEIPSIIR